MEKLFALFMTAFLINNVVLAKFLGICPLLGVSKNRSSALGMGAAVIFTIVGSSIFTYGLYYGILKPMHLEYMNLITFILVIAGFVQFVEMFMKKYSTVLYKALGIYLPLITTNCVVLYVALQNITDNLNFVEMLVYSVAVPAGFALVLYIFSTIRERLEISTTPKPFVGNPIVLIVAALCALAFSGLAGLV